MRTRRAYDSRGSPARRETKAPRTVIFSRNSTAKREASRKFERTALVYLMCVAKVQKRRIRLLAATPLGESARDRRGSRKTFSCPKEKVPVHFSAKPSAKSSEAGFCIHAHDPGDRHRGEMALPTQDMAPVRFGSTSLQTASARSVGRLEKHLPFLGGFSSWHPFSSSRCWRSCSLARYLW